MKYHVNSETGRPNICRATVKQCPVGGAHYETKEEARKGYEQASQEVEVPDPFTKAMMKNPRWAEMEAQINYTRAMNEKLAEDYKNSKVKVNKCYKELPKETLLAYNEKYAALESRLTDEEKESMRDYTGITFMAINKYCMDAEGFIKNNRFPETVEDQQRRIEKVIKNLDSFIAKAPKEKRVVFRRLDQDKTKQFTSSEQWANDLGYRVGEEITFKAFASTTIDPAYISRTVQEDSNTSVVLILKTSSGAPVDYTAVDNNRKNTQEGEREILLPRNSRFKIAKIERVAYESEDYERQEVLSIFMEELDNTL